VKIWKSAKIKIESDPPDPETGKPYMRITFGDGDVVCISTNIGEMIGGAASGARLRWEDQRRGRN
jgi:hypothetical protein